MIRLTLRELEKRQQTRGDDRRTPDELANHLLAETLEMFANKNLGPLEGFSVRSITP